MALFKKNIVVGVSVNPEVGLEVAQIDFASKTVLKYGYRQLGYDSVRRDLADLDLFKDTLENLLQELEIPKGSDIVLNLPTVVFNVADYPAAMDNAQMEMAIEEELMNNPLFQNIEASVSAAILPVSTIQNKKIAYTAAQKPTLIEVVIQIKALGYNVVSIDTSVNSVLNALMYNANLEIAADSNWVLLIVENNACRVMPMLGKSYLESFEEKIAIGEVLGDAENYDTVISAVTPLLKNLPTPRLYVLSRTNVISAKILASKLQYNGQIIHHDDNIFAEAPFLETSSAIDEASAKTISLDVIGAAINREFAPYATAPLNLFNSSLGEVYENEQPLMLGSIALTLERMIIASAVFAAVIIIAIVVAMLPIKAKTASLQGEIDGINNQIAVIEKYLKDNAGVSSNQFDEGDEIRIGLSHNKNIYTYYTVVGTEIPKKLWLTHLKLGKNTTIEGQADNLESIYAFFRNIKDYNPNSGIKLQKLGLATQSKLVELAEDESFDTDSIITSMNADFYEFKISDAPETPAKKTDAANTNQNSGAKVGDIPNVDLGE